MTATLAALLIASQLSGAPRLEIGSEAAAWLLSVPKQDATDFRPRLAAWFTVRPSTSWRAHADVALQGLVADRGGAVTDVVADVREAWIEGTFGAADVRAG